jgi:hypothetical protein
MVIRAICKNSDLSFLGYMVGQSYILRIGKDKTLFGKECVSLYDNSKKNLNQLFYKTIIPFLQDWEKIEVIKE